MKYSFKSLFVFLLGLLIVSGTSEARAHVSNSKPTLEDKVGEMLIVGFRGTGVTKKSPIVSAINDLNLGGVILFDYDMPSKNRKRNIVGRSELKSLISNLERYTNKHLFVSIDLEGGAVNRLKGKYGFKDFPSAESLGRKGNLFTTERIGREIGTQLSEYGFNMDFAPSVDLNVNDDNPIIGAVGRSFSSNPEIVSLHANAFMKGLSSKNIISVIKHFPGHGSSTNDSHLGFVDVTNTYKD
ncbi:MAG: glycoside hydrolase family 3 protein, partial [Candidatus Pacebacteria bacterium]|nr:glycoside hydrolase family 3 protein [Candidatus Paceibacterota bacterium]